MNADHVPSGREGSTALTSGIVACAMSSIARRSARENVYPSRVRNSTALSDRPQHGIAMATRKRVARAVRSSRRARITIARILLWVEHPNASRLFSAVSGACATSRSPSGMEHDSEAGRGGRIERNRCGARQPTAVTTAECACEDLLRRRGHPGIVNVVDLTEPPCWLVATRRSSAPACWRSCSPYEDLGRRG